MECSDIIAIVEIVVSAGVGIWIATIISKGQTKERFLKDYFTNELIGIKEECKCFFDEICYDKKNANDIKIGFKILSMRVKAFENNLNEVFNNVKTNIPDDFVKIQMEITGSDEYNDQFKKSEVKFSAPQKSRILEQRSNLLTAFSKAIITINKASISNNRKRRKE